MKGNIIKKSGGTGKLFAAIAVTYPVGSTLTCTNGTKTLTAKTTSGQWVFAVPEAGTWTVTATDGTNTKSQSVSITREGQTVDIVLNFVVYLFKGGQGEVVDLRSGRESNATAEIGTDTIAVTAAGSSAYFSIVETNDPVDLTNLTKITLSIKCVDEPQASFLYVSQSAQSHNEDLSAAAKTALSVSSSKTTKTLDVSKLSGLYYVGVHGAWEGDIYDWYIE